jgi:hypothetical protein
LNGEVANTNVKVFSLIRPGLESMIDRTFFLHTTIAINGTEKIQDFEERSYIRSLEEHVLFDQVVLLFLFDYILPFLLYMNGM